ncbi:MAG: DUF11 domain-containing protein [Chloroflexi bacterium]|nr:DUF11 domain-containing protein [Chloroflexota bacterium]
MTNGKLAPGTSCTFGVLLEVPVGTASDTYNNSTSDLTAVVDSSLVSVAPAADTLTVSSDLLLLSKTFTDDPVAPGDTATLEFTLTNVHTTQTATDIAFIDDLGAVLSGLVAIGLPANDVCGTGSQISGTNLLIFNGGNLGPGASCTFSVTLQAPGGAAAGTYTNTTSQATGLIDGLSVTGDSATDDLRVNVLTFAKSFDGPTIAGGNPILSFTIQNPSTAVSALSFVDNLDNVLSGLVATGLPVSDVCGAGSELAGTSILTMISGNLEPSATCTFSVTLQVPSGAAPGDYLNETSDLSMFGLPVSAPANATMTVNPTVYLPIILNDVTFAPDLVVTDLSVSDGNAQVVIENQGVTAVIDEFWVDVYINPIPPPTIVNQTWEQLADEGLVWGVTAGALPLAPGESLTLTINGAYYRADLSEFSGTILPGTAVYAQVDSAHTNTAYGAVMETHEMNGDPYNNIYGTTATAGMPTINWLAFTPYFMAQYGYGLSERP